MPYVASKMPKPSSMRRTIEGRLERVQRRGVSLIERHLLQGRRLRTPLLALTLSPSTFNSCIIIKSKVLVQTAQASVCGVALHWEEGAYLQTQPEQAAYVGRRTLSASSWRT